MDLVKLYTLQNSSSAAVVAKYRRLAAAADASQMDSPAQQELAAFFRAWENDPAAATAQAEAEGA